GGQDEVVGRRPARGDVAREGRPAIGGEEEGVVTLVLDLRSLVGARGREREVGIAVEIELEAGEGELRAVLDAPRAESDLQVHRVADVADRWRTDVVDVDQAVAGVVSNGGGREQRRDGTSQEPSPQTILHRDSPPSLSLALWDRADLMDCSRGWMLVRRPPVSAFDVRAPTTPGQRPTLQHRPPDPVEQPRPCLVYSFGRKVTRLFAARTAVPHGSATSGLCGTYRSGPGAAHYGICHVRRPQRR